MRKDAVVKIKGTFIIQDINKMDLHDYWNYFNGGSATRIELYPYVRIIKGEKEIGFKGYIHTVGGRSQLEFNDSIVEYLDLKLDDEVRMEFKFSI